MKKVFEIEEIMNFIKNNKDYGDTITFKELQPFSNFNLQDEFENYKFKSSIMRKVKDGLIEDGYILKSIRNKGYYVLKQNQISSYTYRTYIKKPMKNLLRADDILNHTKTAKLNSQERTQYDLTKKLNIELIAMNNRVLHKQDYAILNKS